MARARLGIPQSNADDPRAPWVDIDKLERVLDTVRTLEGTPNPPPTAARAVVVTAFGTECGVGGETDYWYFWTILRHTAGSPLPESLVAYLQDAFPDWETDSP